MSATPNQFLGREINPEVAKLLKQLSDVINKLPEFGAEIIKWDFERTAGGDYLLPGILFLRNFIGLIDAISILIRNSSVEPCGALLRTALETQFNLEYLLSGDQKRKAYCFLVWNTHRNIKLYKKVDGESEQFRQLKSKYAKDRFLKVMDPIILDDLVKPLMVNAEDLLNLPDYKPIEEEYKRTSSIIRNPNWFSLYDGPKNIEELAAKSNFSGLYEGLYRSWSNTVHGTDIIQGKVSHDQQKRAEIIQIRFPKDAQSMTLHCFNISIPIFRTFVENRTPQRLEDFNKWHLKISKITQSLTDSVKGG